MFVQNFQLDLQTCDTDPMMTSAVAKLDSFSHQLPPAVNPRKRCAMQVPRWVVECHIKQPKWHQVAIKCLQNLKSVVLLKTLKLPPKYVRSLRIFTGFYGFSTGIYGRSIYGEVIYGIYYGRLQDIRLITGCHFGGFLKT